MMSKLFFQKFFVLLAVTLTLSLLSLSVNAQEMRNILVLGDSLSAEYGLARGSGWVKLLADRLQAPAEFVSGSTRAAQQAGASRLPTKTEAAKKSAVQYNVVNASISGETTSGGRTRLPALLAQHRPAIVIIELGANDGLRGLTLSAMRGNLEAMIEMSRKANAKVVLIGMQMPPNFGRDYAEQFFSTFAELARKHKTAYVPFLLEGFAEQTSFFQTDRIHPTAQAQPQILDNVWPQLKPLLN